jgi:hypothetical protein
VRVDLTVASVSPRKLATRSNPEPRWNSVFVGVPGSDIRKKPSLQHGANVKTGTPETTAWTGHRSMFQLFLRARAHNFFAGRGDNRSFKARSTDRDIGTDRSRVGSILGAIEHALHEAEQEQSGLNRRVEDVLARAAATVGNAANEYLDREALDSRHQDSFDAEIANGQRRLQELATAITHFRFLKAATLSRFPDHKPATARD